MVVMVEKKNYGTSSVVSSAAKLEGLTVVGRSIRGWVIGSRAVKQ